MSRYNGISEREHAIHSEGKYVKYIQRVTILCSWLAMLSLRILVKSQMDDRCVISAFEYTMHYLTCVKVICGHPRSLT